MYGMFTVEVDGQWGPCALPMAARPPPLAPGSDARTPFTEAHALMATCAPHWICNEADSTCRQSRMQICHDITMVATAS